MRVEEIGGPEKQMYNTLLEHVRARQWADLMGTPPATPWFQNHLVSITKDHKEGEMTWVHIRHMQGPLQIYVRDLALAIAMGQPETYEFSGWYYNQNLPHNPKVYV